MPLRIIAFDTTTACWSSAAWTIVSSRHQVAGFVNSALFANAKIMYIVLDVILVT